MFTTSYQRPVVHAPSRVPTTPVLATMHHQPVQPIPQAEFARMEHHSRYELPRRTRVSGPDPAQARWSGGIGVILLSLLALLLTACGGGAGAADNEPASTAPATIVAQEAIAPEADDDKKESRGEGGEGGSDAEASEVCADRELHVGELPALDAAWRETLPDAAAPAEAWQADAEFKRLSAMCWIGGELIMDIYHYSAGADEWFVFPENEEHPRFSLDHAVIDPEAVSFADLRDWLNQAGYEDDAMLSTGVVVAPIATDLGDTDPAFAYTVTFGTTELTTVRIDAATGEVLPEE